MRHHFESQRLGRVGPAPSSAHEVTLPRAADLDLRDSPTGQVCMRRHHPEEAVTIIVPCSGTCPFPDRGLESTHCPRVRPTRSEASSRTTHLAVTGGPCTACR